MNCTRCDGTGFLNLHQIPDSELYYLDSPEAIAEWMERNQDNDVQVCDCCGKYLRTKDGQGVSGVSHGLCEQCKDEALRELDDRVPRNEQMEYFKRGGR